jgi:hypothetical protein
MSDHLGSLWRSYRTTVIPLGASAVQARECRRAFYAGAKALLLTILGKVEKGSDEPTEGDLQLMDEIEQELEAFVRSVKEGKA